MRRLLPFAPARAWLLARRALSEAHSVNYKPTETQLRVKVAGIEALPDLLAFCERSTALDSPALLSTALYRVGVLAETRSRSENTHCKDGTDAVVARATKSAAAGGWEPGDLVLACRGAVLAGVPHRSVRQVDEAWSKNESLFALFDTVSIEAVKSMASFGPQNLTELAQAFAALRRPPYDLGGPAVDRHEALFESMAAAAVLKMTDFRSEELSGLAWAYAEGGVSAPMLFDAVAQEALRRGAAAFPSQHIASLAWAFSRAGHSAPVLLDALATEAEKRIDMIEDESLATLARAYSQIAAEHGSKAHNSLFESVASELAAGGKCATLSPQSVADVAEMYVQLKADGRVTGAAVNTLFHAISAAAAPDLTLYHASHVTQLAQACAKLVRSRREKVAPPARALLEEALGAAARAKSAQLKEDDITSLLDAFGTLHVADAASLYESLAHESTRKLSTFEPSAVAQIACALSKAEITSEALSKAMAAHVSAKMAQYAAHELVAVAKAMALWGVPAPKLFEEISSAFRADDGALLGPRHLDHSNVFDLAWAFVMAGDAAESAPLFDAVALKLEEAGGYDLVLKNHKYMISKAYTIYLILEAEAPESKLTHFLRNSEPQLRLSYTKRSHENTSDKFEKGKTQREVSAVLRRLGWEHDYEHVTNAGLVVDLCRPARHQIVEVDGPFHYNVDVDGGSAAGLEATQRKLQRRKPNGKQALRARLLAASGIDLIRIPYFEWMRAKFSSSEEDYIRTKCKRYLDPSNEDTPGWTV